jgi:hypothetical protein
MTNDEAPMTDRSPAVGNPIDYARIDPDHQSRFVIAVLLVLASPFFVDGLSYAVMRVICGDSTVPVFLLGLVTAKFGLVAMWLGWGGSRAIWRMLVVMVSMLFSSFAAPIDRNNLQLFIVLFLLQTICAATIALPRLLGVRWITAWDAAYGNEIVSHRPYQFSIVDILIWTTMAALLAGLIQWIGIPAGIDLMGLAITLVGLVMLSAAVLVAMWAELSVAERIEGRVAAAYSFVAVLAVGTAMLSGAPSDAIGYILGMYLSTASCLLVGLYVLRRFGHRLVRCGRKIEMPSVGARRS